MLGSSNFSHFGEAMDSFRSVPPICWAAGLLDARASAIARLRSPGTALCIVVRRPFHLPASRIRRRTAKGLDDALQFLLTLRR